MKYLFFTTILLGMAACQSAETTDEKVADMDLETEEIIDVEEAPEKKNKINTAEFIIGDWVKIAQDCDSEGKNCRPSEGSDWKFDGKEVYLGQVSQPYKVVNDTIYVNGSPYFVEKTWGDTILFHGIVTERYLKLVRK